MSHQADHHAPVHGSGGAAHQHEPADVSGLADAPGAAPAWRRICVCVDDFGMHGSVNAAALQLAGLGRVQAIGVLVGSPAWREGVVLLRELDVQQVDVGLHLDFTEFPLCAGSRRDLGELIAASALRRLDLRAVRAEIAAQLDAFEQALGRPPAFVDGHQHVHQFAGIRAELVAELSLRYPRVRPWLRSTRHAGSDRLNPKAAFIELLGERGLAALARCRGFAQNAHLLGVYDFTGGAARYRSLLAAWLRRATQADLLMCHPCCQAGPAVAWGAAREAEFEVLASAGFGEMLAGERIVLAPMSRILAQPVFG